MHFPEGEAFAMSGMRSLNGPSDSQSQSSGKRSRSSILEIDSWMPSKIQAISPLVDRLMRLIEGSHCVAGEEAAVELALREALSNAVVHGNGMDDHKLVHVRCGCELGKGVSLIVSDQGQGFDPNAVPDPLAVENLEAEHGRGIHVMKSVMDEVSFERGGTQVRMWKGRNTAQEQSRKTRTNPSPR
jgi:serine/threonine-protein kinase RsbW